MLQETFATKPKAGEPWDVIIVGSGPSALTAAVYTTRGAASTLILGGEKWGGQLMLTTRVDNYPGFPEGVQGPELMQKMRDQAVRFGGEFIEKNVEAADLKSSPFKLTAGGEEHLAKTVIVATGADSLWLGVPGEQNLLGRGVSSCAPCDAPFFKGKNVIVVGGGDSAMEEALTLVKYAASVTIVHRRDALKASAAMQQRVLASPQIKIVWNTVIKEIKGEIKVEGVVLQNTQTQEVSQMPIDGVFVAIGHTPASKIFSDHLELDEKGYVVRKAEEGFHTLTNIRGVFVAGDVHDYHYRQAITAAGFGCMAGMDVLRFLDKPAPSW